MKVYVTGSGRYIGEDLPYLRKIIHTIHATQNTLTRNWIEAANSRRQNGVKDEEADWRSIYTENVDAINRADLAIVETTQDRFSQGYWVYFALQRKRPTLLLTRNVEHLTLYNFTNKHVTLNHYQNEEELEKIVTNFIKAYTIPAKDLRFNFFIDRQIYKYLRDKSYETGKNKSEIIRELLEQEINRHE